MFLKRAWILAKPTEDAGSWQRGEGLVTSLKRKTFDPTSAHFKLGILTDFPCRTAPSKNERRLPAKKML